MHCTYTYVIYTYTYMPIYLYVSHICVICILICALCTICAYVLIYSMCVHIYVYIRI